MSYIRLADDKLVFARNAGDKIVEVEYFERACTFRLPYEVIAALSEIAGPKLTIVKGTPSKSSDKEQS
ncbi:MAG: hypothetical protein HRF49_10195 [bacterium]|jgi:hypothetical protein